MKKTNPNNLWAEFPAMQLVRTGHFIRLVGKLTFAVLILSIAGMIFLPWQQTASGTGSVVALDPQQRPQAVSSQTKGIVGYVKPGLREGSYIEKGELLLRLTPTAAEGVSQLDTSLMAIEAKKAAAQSILLAAEQMATIQESSGRSIGESLNRDYEAAQQKWEQAKNEVLALQAEMVDKENQLRIAEDVAQKGLIAQEELVSKRQMVAIQQAKLLKSESAVGEAFASLVSKENEIEGKKQEIEIKNRAANQKILDEMQKINSIEKELIELQTKRDEFDRLEICAPRSGYIQQWYGLEGSDTVKEGDQLFVVVPDATELGVELKVSGNDMPLIKEGDSVRLQFEGWPAVQFVGWPSVAIGTFGGKVNRVFPTDDGKGFFSIVIIPDQHFQGEGDWPSDRYLRQGVRANGWILLNRVSLGYEIWRQLNGFPPVIANDEPGKSKENKVKLPKM